MARVAILLASCIFGGLIFLNPWFGIPCIGLLVVYVFETHRLKVKIKVTGEVLERVLALEKLTTQLTSSVNVRARTPMGGMPR